ncbi:MAG: hypothetical protein WAJ87_25620 [Bryobacteraceae bacterium]
MPDALELDLRVEDNALRIDAYALFNQRDTVRRFDRDHKRHLGAYSAKSNHTVTIRAVRQMGVQPFDIGVFPLRQPRPTLPLMKSDVQSVQLSVAAENRAEYKIGFRNVGRSGVVSIAIGGPSGGHGDSNYEFVENHMAPLIPPGTTYYKTFGKENHIGIGGVSSPLATRIDLSGVLFQDGMSEGDRNAVAPLKGLFIGWEIQSRNSDAIMKRFLQGSNAPRPDLSILRREFETLPEAVDAADEQQIRRKYPNLSCAALSLTRVRESQGLTYEKKALLKSLDDFERSGGSLRSWWTDWQRRQSGKIHWMN